MARVAAPPGRACRGISAGSKATARYHTRPQAPTQAAVAEQDRVWWRETQRLRLTQGQGLGVGVQVQPSDPGGRQGHRPVSGPVEDTTARVFDEPPRDLHRRSARKYTGEVVADGACVGLQAEGPWPSQEHGPVAEERRRVGAHDKIQGLDDLAPRDGAADVAEVQGVDLPKGAGPLTRPYWLQ